MVCNEDVLCISNHQHYHISGDEIDGRSLEVLNSLVEIDGFDGEIWTGGGIVVIRNYNGNREMLHPYLETSRGTKQGIIFYESENSWFMAYPLYDTLGGPLESGYMRVDMDIGELIKTNDSMDSFVDKMKMLKPLKPLRKT